MNIKTYKKENGDLNIDIESLIKQYPQLAGSKCDDEEQKLLSVALIPYIIVHLKERDVYYVKQLQNLLIGLQSVRKELIDINSSGDKTIKQRQNKQQIQLLVCFSLLVLIIIKIFGGI